MVPASKTLQIPQALVFAQDPEQSHQEQVPGRSAHATPNACIGDRYEKADRLEIGCGKGTCVTL